MDAADSSSEDTLIYLRRRDGNFAPVKLALLSDGTLREGVEILVD